MLSHVQIRVLGKDGSSRACDGDKSGNEKDCGDLMDGMIVKWI